MRNLYRQTLYIQIIYIHNTYINASTLENTCAIINIGKLILMPKIGAPLRTKEIKVV